MKKVIKRLFCKPKPVMVNDKIDVVKPIKKKATRSKKKGK